MGHLTVTIVDAPCGAGKTTYAIQMMNKSIQQEGDNRFIFITPFCSEIKRIKAECPGFYEPCDGGRSRTKSADFKKLLQDGKNIVSTHALFKLIDKEALELIQMDNYTLILDEVMDVLEKEPIFKSDLRLLLDQGYIVIDGDDATVKATDKSEEYLKGNFKKFLNNARMNRFIYLEENLLMWQFPPDIFQAFETSYILTYLFDGQIQKAYFDLHGVGYEYKTVNKTPDGYGLTDLKVDYDREFRNMLRDNVNIYEGRLNKIDEPSNALSRGWFEDKKNAHLIAKAKAAQYNFFHNIVRGRSGEIMWTCFKANKEVLKGAGYSRGFVSHNTRATNEYRDRKSLSYMINKYPLAPVTMYFNRKGIAFDWDKYAVSEFIQWLLRSQIRDGKPVNLFLPSRRMRTLFREWMVD